jgi:type I restriction enzyme S subunit
VKLPDGWKNYKLGDLFYKRTENGKEGLPTVSVTINNGIIRRDSIDRKMETNLGSKDHLLINKGDIAYNMMRMWQGALGLAEYDGNVSPAYVVLAPTKEIDSHFASFWFKSSRMIYLFWAFSYGLTNDRLRLYYKDLAIIPVSIPSLPEQKAIADILSTWDDAIEKTQVLIAVKEKQFKWLLKKLISDQAGKPGWRKVKLGEVAKITMGSSPPSSAYNENGEGLPLLQGKADLKARKSSPRIFTKKITNECKISDLLLSVRAPVGYISRAKHNCCIGRGIAAISVHKNCNTDFIFYQLIFSEKNWTRVSQGGTFDAVSSDEVKRFMIIFPKLKEQKQIAEMLNTTQSEINLLKQVAEKYKEQKHGLMQKLLTGKWRVKINEKEM